MQKIVLRFGLIAGALVSILMLVGMVLMVGPDGKVNLDHGQLFGYISMIVSLSLIFFGIRSYRDQNGGKISFGKAFKVGILITLVASVMYVITWMAYYHTTDKKEEFGKQMMEYKAETLKKKGVSEADIANQIAADEEFMKVYDSNPLIMFAITLLEIFPVGLVITLLSSIFLRTKLTD
ncbi:MAG: DUF4199 domain-containing protein [Saprospiraceae bacterium]|nr:DUF4199 domain-containing protein [Saprospiraceae bacterium]